jgi:hypothetical protein
VKGSRCQTRWLFGVAGFGISGGVLTLARFAAGEVEARKIDVPTYSPLRPESQRPLPTTGSNRDSIVLLGYASDRTCFAVGLGETRPRTGGEGLLGL